MVSIKSMFHKVFGRLLIKIGTEPVFLSTMAIIALTTYNSAVEGGLGPEDALIAAAFAVLGLLSRELVIPVVKVDAATGALKPIEEPVEPEPPLEPPYFGDNS